MPCSKIQGSYFFEYLVTRRRSIDSMITFSTWTTLECLFCVDSSRASQNPLQGMDELMLFICTAHGYVCRATRLKFKSIGRKYLICLMRETLRCACSLREFAKTDSRRVYVYLSKCSIKTRCMLQKQSSLLQY